MTEKKKMTETVLKQTHLISPLARVNFSHGLRKRYPKGTFKQQSPIAAGRELGECVVKGLDFILQKEASPIRVSVETDHSRYVPPGLTGGHGIMRGLVILTATGRTHVVDMSVSPTVVRLDGQPYFIDHPEGAPALLEGLIEVVDAVIASEKDVEG